MDLELNEPEGLMGGDIIEIGVAVGSKLTGIGYLSEQTYTKAKNPLQQKIIDLCHIDVVDYKENATSAIEGWSKILKSIDSTYAPSEPICMHILTWGIGDVPALMTRLRSELFRKHSIHEWDSSKFSDRRVAHDAEWNTLWPYSKRFIDVKAIYQGYMIAQSRSYKGGLKTCCEKLGLTFVGEPHKAMFDAINTLLIFRELCKLMGRTCAN